MAFGISLTVKKGEPRRFDWTREQYGERNAPRSISYLGKPCSGSLKGGDAEKTRIKQICLAGSSSSSCTRFRRAILLAAALIRNRVEELKGFHRCKGSISTQCKSLVQDCKTIPAEMSKPQQVPYNLRSSLSPTTTLITCGYRLNTYAGIGTLG